MSEQTSLNLTSPSQRIGLKRCRCRLALGWCPKQVYQHADLLIWCGAGGVISGRLLTDFGFITCMFRDDEPGADRAASPS